MSFWESNGFAIWPFAPTEIAREGSTGVPPPRRRTGVCFNAASARIFSQSS
jgi:hypothetical protein